MSISIQEAREKLDILQRLTNEPQLIFTNLITSDADDYNFLCQINIVGNDISFSSQGAQYSEYIPKYLQTLSPFKNTIIKVWGAKLRIYIPSLKHGEYQSQSDDRILDIDLYKKTYTICEQSIESYTSILEKEYTLETCELPDFWKKFEDFTFEKRLKGAFSSLTSDKKLHIRIFDFIGHLTIPRRKIDATLAKVKEEINEKNERKQYFYNEQIEFQNFYKEHAPAQIERIREKQGEIVEYLKGLGYTNRDEVDEENI